MKLLLTSKVLICIFSYLFGSIPFGFVIGKIKNKDIRNLGSGNIGATNVARILGTKLGLLTVILDGFKGLIPAFLGSFFSNSFGALTGFIAICGHIFPIYLKFKGGKGIATTIFTYFAINTPIAIAIVTTWMCVFALTKYSSLAGIFAILIGFLLSLITLQPFIIYFAAFTFLLVVYRHKDNILRLIQGKENKFI